MIGNARGVIIPRDICEMLHVLGGETIQLMNP
jgi:antitoxin component of MazEF toxin-antitoxin module